MLLREIPDAPVVLYKIGNADLDAEKLVVLSELAVPRTMAAIFVRDWLMT